MELDRDEARALLDDAAGQAFAAAQNDGVRGGLAFRGPQGDGHVSPEGEAEERRGQAGAERPEQAWLGGAVEHAGEGTAAAASERGRPLGPGGPGRPAQVVDAAEGLVQIRTARPSAARPATRHLRKCNIFK